MTRTAPVAVDTSVVIAALLTWHERHDDAAKALEAALSDRAGAILPLPSLVEAYSVITRLPAPNRVRPAAAAEILFSSLRGRVRLATLAEDQSWDLIAALNAAGIAGGRTYDAHIAACAKAAGAARLLTLNTRDFAAVAPDLELIVL